MADASPDAPRQKVPPPPPPDATMLDAGPPQAPPAPVGIGTPSGDETGWKAVGSFVWRYVASMFLEQKGGTNIWAVSLGRVSTVGLLMQAMWTWQHAVDLLPGQKEVLYVMVGYTFGSKTIGAVKDIVTAVKGDA